MQNLHFSSFGVIGRPPASHRDNRRASINAALGAPLPSVPSSRWRLEPEPMTHRARPRREGHTQLVHRVLARVQGLARAWLRIRVDENAVG
jgi:hypothetical protein